MIPEPVDCERCGATTVTDTHRTRPREMEVHFRLSPDEQTIEDHSPLLCRECRAELRNWIANGPDRDGLTDLVEAQRASRSLEQTAEDLLTIAEELNDAADAPSE